MSLPSDREMLEQLARLRALTASTGAVHEAQKLQIQLWPHTLDSRLDHSVAEISVDTKTLRYVWTAKKVSKTWKPTPAYRTKMGILASRVRFLFGLDWITTVVLNGNPMEIPSGDPKEPRSSGRRTRPRRGSKKRTRSRTAR